MNVNLLLLKKDGSQKDFPLPSSVTVIGRRHDCDLRIPLASVSKRHCQLNYNNGVLEIRDLGSRNGTILNGKPVNETAIQAGDLIKIGPIAFVLQIDGRPENPGAPAAGSAVQKPSQKNRSTDDSTVEGFKALSGLE